MVPVSAAPDTCARRGAELKNINADKPRSNRKVLQFIEIPPVTTSHPGTVLAPPALPTRLQEAKRGTKEPRGTNAREPVPIGGQYPRINFLSQEKKGI